MRDLAFMAFFVAYLPVVVRFPHVGAMLWAWLSFCSPDEYLFGFMTDLPLSKIVAVITLAALVMQRDGRKPYVDGVMAMMLGFVLVGLVSALLSVTPLPTNWDLFGKVAKIVVLCFVVTIVVISRQRLQGMVLAIALGLAFNGVDEGLKVLGTAGGHHVLGVATMGDNNSFAVAMLMCIPLLLYLYTTTIHPLTRFALICGVVLCVVAVIGTYSRGGFLGLLTLALGLIALNRNKIRNLIGVVVAAVVLYQFAPDAWFQRINTLGQVQVDTSFTDRITAWKVSLLIALDRPFYGGGFHAVQDTDVYLRYGQDLAKVDFMASAPLRPTGMAAHSIYFEVLGDLGFTGLLLFVGMLMLAIRSCSVIRARARAHADMGWMVDLASMLRLSLIVYMVSGAALSFAYFEGVYLMAALLSVTRRMQAVELAKRAKAAPALQIEPEVAARPEEEARGWVPAWEEYGSVP